MRKLLVVGFVSAGLSIPMILLLRARSPEMIANAKAFERLKLGMTRAEGLRAVGRKPTCAVKIGRSIALLFKADQSTFKCVEVVRELHELPNVYATLEILVGADDKVLAIGYVGDLQVVKTSRGDFPGSSISQLPS